MKITKKIFVIVIILGLLFLVVYENFNIKRQQNIHSENVQKLKIGMYIDDVITIMGTPSTQYEPEENPNGLSPGFRVKLTYDTNKEYGDIPITLLFNRWKTLYEIDTPDKVK